MNAQVTPFPVDRRIFPSTATVNNLAGVILRHITSLLSDPLAYYKESYRVVEGLIAGNTYDEVQRYAWGFGLMPFPLQYLPCLLRDYAYHTEAGRILVASTPIAVNGQEYVLMLSYRAPPRENYRNHMIVGAPEPAQQLPACVSAVDIRTLNPGSTSYRTWLFARPT
jgi:hypothetical protein